MNKNERRDAMRAKLMSLKDKEKVAQDAKDDYLAKLNGMSSEFYELCDTGYALAQLIYGDMAFTIDDVIRELNASYEVDS